MKEFLHLSGRFLRSIRPGSLSVIDTQWVRLQLSAAEIQLWERMSNPDQRHGVEVARLVEAELGEEATVPVLAAALLHDVGKIESGLRTPARVLATLVWAVVPDRFASRWTRRVWPLNRLGQYRLHPEIGEELLTSAGSDKLVAAWAGDHHQAERLWRVDAALGRVLKECDDD